MKKRRRSYNYKFTEKKHSIKGIVGLILAILSILLWIIMIDISYTKKGNGTVYLGSIGVLSMLFALVSVIFAIFGMREEKSYRFFSVLATVGGMISFLGWLAIYILGFLGI